MGNYIIGGWSQTLSSVPPKSFTYAMVGMVTNFPALTVGTAAAPGWGPATASVPQHPPCQTFWTYGGAGGAPAGTPSSAADIQAIVNATNSWAGVDFDNESQMNVANIAATMQALKAAGKGTSYTFLAGWDYNNNPQGPAGVKQIADSGAADRFILMCYADAMWPMSDITANVGPAIKKTIAQGVPPEKVILALTYSGLTQENLDYFLNQVTQNQIGGLFIWEYPSLSSKDLSYICSKLGIAN